jgi:very-short-patch-repair endonuclease
MKKYRIHNPEHSEEKRDYLRKHMTPAEAYLWTYLKARKLKGRRISRQHGIGPYTVDFYCAKEKLIIELDGEVHNNSETQEYDVKRTTYLTKLGYKVIRFENHLVFDHINAVLREITAHFNK